MNIIESVAATVIGTGLYDWLVVTGSAARFTSFNYDYLPLSLPRWASLVLLGAAGFYFCMTINPDQPPIVPLVLLGLAIVIHGSIAVQNMFAQRRRAQFEARHVVGGNVS
jgi:uncharacterized RDD family membrane protein YckC